MQPATRDNNYAASAGRGLSIAQLVLGALCLICGIISTVLYRRAFYGLGIIVITGAIEIWTPIPFILAGIFGILAARGSNSGNGMIVAHMVLSIVSTVFAFILFVEACIYAALLGPHIAIAIMAFAEFVISIISSALCCRAICCRTVAQRGVVLGSTSGNTVVVTTAPGQPMVYHQQPGQYVVQPAMQPGMQQQAYYAAAPPPGTQQYPQYATPQYPPAGGDQTKPPPYV